MKTNSKNSKNNIDNKNIQNMQKKIRDQAKRLCSMQEYINTLETTIKENQSNNSLKINQQSYDDLSRKYSDLQQKYNSLFISSQIHSSSNSIANEDLNKENLLVRLEKENSDLKSKLQKEIKKNKDQQNQIEYFKQNLETDIVKSGLRGCLNYLSEKLINTEKDGEEAYFEILCEINKIREENQKLLKQLEKIEIPSKKAENFQKPAENFEKNIDIINRLNNENNNLYSQNEMMQNEMQILKNNLAQIEKNLYDLKEENYLIIRENEVLKNDNNNLIETKRENNNLINTLNQLEDKINELTEDNKRLSDYKLGYDLVLKENNELKKLNQDLSYDNALFEQDVYILQNHIDKLADVGKNNEILKNELEDLRNLLNNLKNKKQVNNIFEKVSELEQKNKELESQLHDKENNKISSEKCLNEMINKYDYKTPKESRKVNLNTKKEMNKYIMANKYYADLLLRVLKFHIKDNSDIKNILFQLLDLNHKKIVLSSEIENIKNNCNNPKSVNKNNSKNDINKTKTELKKKEKELSNLDSTISYFDKELKKFEPK